MLNATINNGSVAQLNRALDYGSRGYGVMSRFFVVPLFAADRCASGGHAAHFLYSKTMLMPTSRHENKVFLSIFAL